MVRLPLKEKCDVECLAEYRFDNLLFHSMAYLSDSELICLGTSRGKILSYNLPVGK